MQSVSRHGRPCLSNVPSVRHATSEKSAHRDICSRRGQPQINDPCGAPQNESNGTLSLCGGPLHQVAANELKYKAIARRGASVTLIVCFCELRQSFGFEASPAQACLGHMLNAAAPLLSQPTLRHQMNRSATARCDAWL